MAAVTQVKGQRRVGMTGDEAVAYAVKQADVDVIAAYPITPQTIIVERLAEYVNNGELNAAFIPVESEHSALSTCVGASLAGARVFTATASQGLALMYEILWIASSMRTTIVMALANRALSAPINIHCSHDDAYAARDTGWIQFFAENVQEAYDLTIQAFRVAEDKRVLLPTIINLDGFILSHSLEGLYVLSDDEVRKFLPPKEPVNPIDVEKPMTYGPLALYDYYYEFKRAQAEAMKTSYPVILEVFKEYEKVSGRKYAPVKAYGMEDAEVAMVILGSSAGTARYVARRMRERGEKVGVLSLTLYRPFPEKEIVKYLKNVKAAVIMDRSYSFGSPGAQLFMDIAAALYNEGERPLLINAIYGLGGRDLTPEQVEAAFRAAFEAAKTGVVKEREIWLGVR
ncbi:MAG: pyruvate ferredoxin oxidoreductase [Thermoprotei archaeon]|nr:MAG: pyruvate ferredoxin oxidoreductase [Thermoprotei archaeon]